MKFNKIFAVALAALTLTACNDDDDVNSVPVTVSMQQSTMSVGEDVSAGVYYNVPVVLSANPNGPVTVTVEVEGVGAEPAQEGKDLVITQKTITIPAGEQIGYIQFYPVGDEEINDDREILFTITKATGATIGNEATCRVTFIDNEKFIPDAYAKVQGVWNVSTDDGNFTVNVQGYPEGDPNYLKKIVINNFNGYPFCSVEANFSFDAATMEASLTMPFGQTIASGVQFDAPIGLADIRLASFDGSSLSFNGNVVATSNPEMTMMTWNGGVCGAIMTGGNFSGYIWFGYLTLTMNKVN